MTRTESPALPCTPEKRSMPSPCEDLHGKNEEIVNGFNKHFNPCAAGAMYNMYKVSSKS